MKIPDNEMQALFDWSTDELERIEREYPYASGILDGRGVAAQKEHFKEYNNRLASLEEQYASSPVAKTQTFSQVRKRIAVTA